MDVLNRWGGFGAGPAWPLILQAREKKAGKGRGGECTETLGVGVAKNGVPKSVREG